MGSHWEDKWGEKQQEWVDRGCVHADLWGRIFCIGMCIS